MYLKKTSHVLNDLHMGEISVPPQNPSALNVFIVTNDDTFIIIPYLVYNTFFSGKLKRFLSYK